jgi:hypothetical protein
MRLPLVDGWQLVIAWILRIYSDDPRFFTN